MGKHDKDRHQKELAIRLCLARGMVPFLEVVVPSASDLSDSTEVLTDLDVVGLEFINDGGLRRTIFDCKTSKMSAINRAFWAAGVARYTGCDESYVILKSKAVHNHRISALSIGVDLHDEKSFEDIGKSSDPSFGKEIAYQSSIDRWNLMHDAYTASTWSTALFELARNASPTTKNPASTFRKIISEIRANRGNVDPVKPHHLAIFFDVLASTFILWTMIGRDIRRFYEPSMKKADFEKILRYYIWGGKESYQIRQQLRTNIDPSNAGNPVDLPAWDKLLSFAGLVISSPQDLFVCAHVCREMALKIASSPKKEFDDEITKVFSDNKRVRQYALALSDYLVSAGGLPTDMGKAATGVLTSL